MTEEDPLNLSRHKSVPTKTVLRKSNLNRQGGMHAAYRQPRPDEKIPEYVDAKRLFIRGEPREVNFVLVPAATIQCARAGLDGKAGGRAQVLALAGRSCLRHRT